MSQQDYYKTLFQNIPCGVFEYQAKSDGIIFRQINTSALKMYGYDETEFWQKKSWPYEGLINMEDFPAVRKAFLGLKQVGDTGEFMCRIKQKGGGYLWVSGTMCLTDISEEGNIYQNACFDIDKQKRFEQQLLLNQEKMEIALANSQISLWDYDTRTKMCMKRDIAKNIFDTPPATTPEEMIATGRIHPDYAENCRELFAAIDSGEPFVSTTLPFLTENGEFRYIKMNIKRNGTDPVAVGWSEDIDASERNKRRLMSEIEQQDRAASKNLLARGRFNLTDNIVENYTASENVQVGYVGQSYKEWCEGLAATTVSETQREELRQFMDKKNILAEYEEGKMEGELVYQRYLRNGKQLWVSTTRHLYLDSETNKLVLFIYTNDVTNDYIFREMVKRVDCNECEMLSVLYPDQDVYRILFSKISGDVENDATYSENCELYAKHFIPEYCRKEAIQALSIPEIRTQLEKQNSYNVTFPVEENHKSVRKKWNFYYLDDAHTVMIVNRSDVTELFVQQQQQRETIESALLSARQANSAKSNFLSRMSHEIRTPMNAILGMCALAAQSIGNDEEVSDCISKIGIAGHYLLSLINDVLDMSRIESGKMLLQKEPFRIDEFVSGVNTVIYGQTQDKKIDYETLVDAQLEETYVGDAMKLQQILVNILGNAVKFTSEGGKISFAIHAGPVKNQIQRVIFTVNDTGKGIEEKSLERIFEPFEQQDGSITREYGGSGLGLAICKNLTELMGGSIHCKSIVGVGSEFTVSLPMMISKKQISLPSKTYSFDKMHALIVDDDITICESTARTLKDIGMIPEWVCSGMEAVERVKHFLSRNKSYDFILIDWKMPEMDGIETARQIRRLVGPDVTIIIITAYDWISIERAAKLAGVNMCISKPMFKSTLISAFQKSVAQKEDEITKPETSYDFTGIRILLAEDHPMNAEIARKLLNYRNCEVEIAENGLKAMEYFTTKPVGYYQAILMDVRMPVMDGLQACANIRRWNTEDAKTIPIIAMTANAFDEDVEKCRAAGMNAHLAKPIEPELLYHTIQKFTQSDVGLSIKRTFEN